METRVLLTPPLPKKIVDIFRGMLPEGCTLQVAAQMTPDFDAALKEADFVVAIPRVPLESEFFGAAPKLKLVQLITAGFENVDAAAARSAKVPVCNNGGANGVAVAEHAMMLVLAAMKRVVWYHRNVEAGKWRVGTLADQPIAELEGKTLGLVGFGKIGRKLAEFARVFGMKIVYHDLNRLPHGTESALAADYRSFDELLACADVVSVHVPLSASTKGLFGAAVFAKMKPGAILINTSRGAVLNEPDLVEALTRPGGLGGAGLDVMTEEPPPASHPLLKLGNVVITPHVSAAPMETWTRMFRAATENIVRVRAGEEPLWRIGDGNLTDK